MDVPEGIQERKRKKLYAKAYGRYIKGQPLPTHKRPISILKFVHGGSDSAISSADAQLASNYTCAFTRDTEAGNIAIQTTGYCKCVQTGVQRLPNCNELITFGQI